MKKIVRSVVLINAILVVAGMMNFTAAQAPPAPPSHGQSGNQGKAPAAPLEGGILVSLAMIAGYGAWKMARTKRNKE